MPGELIIGLMSGTSVDGIDAALVDFNSESQLRVVDTLFTPYEYVLQQQINQLAQQNNTPKPSEYAELHIELANLYAKASLDLISKSGVAKNSISAIANHGQTIAHEPNASSPFSLQIGDSQLIANLTELTTISQFRQADIIAGGQGAPLMPAFHQSLLSSNEQSGNLFVLNLGGIANITSISDKIVGFDTGPANTLLNQWVQYCKNKSYDENGSWAKSGENIPAVLNKLISDPFFKKPYPKSTGPDYFNLDWLRSSIDDLEQYPKHDIQATLLELSVETIAKGFAQIKSDNGVIYPCGGGIHNLRFMSRLKERLDNYNFKPIDTVGVPSDWVEAAGFAWLGYCHLHDIPSNLPSVTGASKKIVLGEQFYPES